MGNGFDLTVNPLSGNQLEVLADDTNSLTGAEKVLVVQGSTVKETTTQDIANLGVLSATVTLTDAQIKALPTTPIEIVAAPGANKITLISSIILHLDWTADYTNIAGINVVGALSGTNNGYMGGLLESAGDVSGLLANGQDSFAFLFPVSNSYIDNGLINDAFYLKSLNNSGNYTGGNAANTLKVTVYYIVVDL